MVPDLGEPRAPRDPEDGRRGVYVPRRPAIELIPVLVDLMIWGIANTRVRIPPEQAAAARQREELIPDHRTGEVPDGRLRTIALGGLSSTSRAGSFGTGSTPNVGADTPAFDHQRGAPCALHRRPRELVLARIVTAAAPSASWVMT